MTDRGRTTRDALIGSGAAIAALGLVVLGAAVLLRLIDGVRSDFVPTAYNVGQGFDLAHFVVLGGAFVIACVAFLGHVGTRESRLRLAAIVAACAFALSVVAQSLYADAYSVHHYWTELFVSELLGAAGALVSIVAASVAAVAFHGAIPTDPSDQSRRDGILGWAATALALGLTLTTASSLVEVATVILFPEGNTGLWISAAGSVVGIVTGALAAVALFASRRDQRGSDRRWVPRREALLAIALGVFFVATALQGIGAAVTANAVSRGLATGLDIAAYWVAASSAWVLCVGAACAAIGFLHSAVSTAEAA